MGRTAEIQVIKNIKIDRKSARRGIQSAINLACRIDGSGPNTKIKVKSNKKNRR